MFRVTKVAVAAIQVLAVTVLPLMLDRCAESCDAHQTPSATPPCHHAPATGTHITAVPSSCGHDHNATAVGAAKDVAPTPRALVLLATANGHVSVAPQAAATLRFDPHAPPDVSPPLAGRSLPLRV